MSCHVNNRKLVYWNCNHYTREKQDQIAITVQHDSPALIALAEVWPRNSTPNRPALFPQLPNYTWHSLSAPDSPGVGAFAHKNYRFCMHDSLNRIPAPPACEIELLWLKLTLNTNTDVLIGIVYRSPSYNNRPAWLFLAKALQIAHTLSPHVILVGDLNAHHTEFSDRSIDAAGCETLRVMSDSSMLNMNAIFAAGIPTYIQGSVLDLVFASPSNIVDSITVDHTMRMISDHYPVSVTLSTADPVSRPANQPALHRTWNILKANWEEYTAHLDMLMEHMVQPALPPAELIDHMWDSLKLSIHSAAEQHVGRKTIRPHHKHWWNSHPDQIDPQPLLDDYRRAHREYHRTSTSRQDSLLKDACTTARSAWLKVRSECIASSWTSLCNSITYSTDCKKQLWNYFKRTVPSDFIAVTAISTPSNAASSAQESMNHLATYFADTCSLHKGDFDLDTEHTVDSFFRTHPSESTGNYDSPFTAKELQSAYDLLNMNSASGPDDIHSLFLKHSPDSFRVQLLTLINLTWTHSHVPADWTSANVCPLYKGKGDKSVPSSFRPISLTSLVVKLVERMITSRISGNIFAQLSPMQSGFRPGFCTNDNIFRVLSAVSDALVAKSHLPCVFLDLKKAFDSVWIRGLLYKLHGMGIRGKAWSWIRAFLSNRKLRVSQSGHHSDWHDITAGVPQGSVLAPLLFLVFINDLAGMLHHDTIGTMYADDVALFPKSHGVDGHQPLQHSLEACGHWAYQWKMVFSTEKSNVVWFTRKRKFTPPTTPLSMSATFPITAVGQYTFLGLTLHSQLKWKAHFEKVISKVRYSSHLIARVITQSGPPNAQAIRTFTQAILVSQYSYALMFWKPTDQQFREIMRAIVAPLRKALQLPWSTSQMAILNEYGILTPQHQRQFQLLSFFQRAALNQHSLVINPVHEVIGSLRDRELRRLDTGTSSSRDPFSPIHELIAVFIETGYSLTNSLITPKQTMLQLQLKNYINSTPSTASRGLRDVKTLAGCSDYIRMCEKKAACTIAMFRHDFARFGSSIMQHRIDAQAAAQSRCPLCAGTTDSRAHAVMECPGTMFARITPDITLQQLRRANKCHITEPTLRHYLGDFNQTDFAQSHLQKSRFMRPILNIMATYLMQLYSHRFQSNRYHPP
jgi:hypothetical protein